jgi:hypothetical protein
MADKKQFKKPTLREIGYSIFGIAFGLFIGKYYPALTEHHLLVMIIALLVLTITPRD